MAHMVICAICKEKFDRDKVKCVKYGSRRYAHFQCYPEGEEVILPSIVDEDKVALEEYIKKLYGIKKLGPVMNKQIKQFIEENDYTYSGIRKTLLYFYEIQHHTIEEKYKNSLGIVPYVYAEACQYFYSLYLAEQANKDKVCIDREKIVTIKSPKPKVKKVKLFNLEEDNDVQDC